MAVKAVVWHGSSGLATDLKLGIDNSAAFMQSIDFRKSPSQLSVLPGLTRGDPGIVKDLVGNEVMAGDGTIYGFGNQGYFYRGTTTGLNSMIDKLGSGCFGMDYRKDTDAIYLTSNKTVSLYNPVSGTASLTPDKYGPSASTYNNSITTGFNVLAAQSGSLMMTSLMVAASPLSEASSSLRYFQSDIEPLQRIAVFVVNKGTGNWTLTLHDGLNNVLGTVTILNASLSNNTWANFVFTSQIRIYPAPNARTYHIHVTSTVADGVISSSVTNDLSTIDLQIWADRLIVTNNGLHPMVRFQQFECIGNANYLSVWEPISDIPTNTEWLRHRLVFPSEYEVCGITEQNEFLVIACEKTTSNGNTPQEGILFFWDGLSATYNYDVPIPEGAPHGLHNYKNVAEYFASGSWYGVTGPTSLPVKLRTMPGTDTEFSGGSAPITVYPYAATVRRGVHLSAFPSVTTNASINFGVYSWGAVDKNYPDTLGYSYVISTGSQNYSASNNLQIGMVKSFGDVLHVSWRDDLNGGYGMDVITNASKPASFATWQSLITDNKYMARDKQAVYVDASFFLPAGATITLGYKLNREANWHNSPPYSTVNLWQGRSGYARFNIADPARYAEAQVALFMTCDSTVTVSPLVYECSLVYDDLRAESLI